jgi:RNA-directed DNA polymerase
MAKTTQTDSVRQLQRTLYRAAKADPKRRFHALYDKIYRRDVLERAWEEVRRNRGAGGVDGVTTQAVDAYGAARLLDDLEQDLRGGRVRPLPARRVYIPKGIGTGEQRPLAIPAVRDRIVQAAAKLVIEPIFEADFLPCSYGFRPERSTHDALQVLIDEAWGGRRWVVETDVASCFEAIPHSGLEECLEARICDQSTLKLLRAMLRAGVLEAGVVERRMTGTPQGGVISPLLANIYLHRVDEAWDREGTGVLVRYADDLVVMCRSREEAEAALALLRRILSDLGLELKDAKTRIIHLEEGGDGFDFLGFHHRWVRARLQRRVTFLARWPSRMARQRARDRLRELTASDQQGRPIHTTIAVVNRFLRGWMGYFRYGNSAKAFRDIWRYAVRRVSRLIARQHSRTPRWGRALARSEFVSPTFGLPDPVGVVIPPRPYKPWRRGC